MTPSSPASEKFDSILAALIEARDQTGQVDLAAWTARYPQYADQIRSFFSHQEKLEGVLGPRGAVDPEAPTIGMDKNLQAGHRIRYFGDYELLTEIARGGMGVVFKARQVSLNRVVALKMILSGQLAGPSDVQRFRGEAEAAAHLDHPHIVPIYEVGEREGQHYFSMKLIEGSNLSQARAHRTGVAWKDQQMWAAALVAQVARAVHHAHQRGILHRDLKPGNILLDAAGEPHVTDFGLAKKVEGGSDLTNTGAIVGTPAYMAPEQARCEKGLSTAVDVYSLGGILYELLTGKPPFHSATPLDTILEVLEKEPARPTSLNPAIDRDLETITLKCMEKEPGKRYRSAEALAEELERWRRGEAIHARPVGWSERSWKWMKRNPLQASLAAVSLLALLAISLVYLIANFQVQEHEQARTDAQKERDKAVDVARIIRYTQGIAVGEKALELGDPNIAEKRLLSLDTALRSWEWNALYGRTRAQLTFLIDEQRRATKGVGSSYLRQATFLKGKPDLAACRPMGHHWGTEPGELTLWDTQKRAMVQTHSDVFFPVTISPDSESFASAKSYQGPITIRDMKTGKLKAELPDWGQTQLASYSPDGKQLAVSFMNKANVNIIALWDVSAGQLRCQCAGHLSPTTSLVFSPEGQLLLTAHEKSADLILWDAKTGKEVRKLSPMPESKCLTFHPQGQVIAGTDGDQIMFWDVKSGEVKKNINDRTTESRESINKYVVRSKGARDIDAIAYTPDGRYLVIGHSSGTERGTHEFMGYALGTVRVLEAEAAKEILMLRGQIGTPGWFAFDADGLRLAWSGNDDGVTICELDRLLSARTVSGFGPVDVSSDGRLIAWCDGCVHVADARDGGLVLPPMGNLNFGPLGVAFSHDGKRVAGGNVGGSWNVPIWDLETGQQVAALKHNSGPAYRLAFSPDDRLVLVCNAMSVEVYNASTGQLVKYLREEEQGKAYCGAFSPDSRYLVTGHLPTTNSERTGRLMLWDTETWKSVRGQAVLQDGITSVAWNPEGTLIAACAGIPQGDSSGRSSDNPHQIVLCDRNLSSLRILEGHAADVNAVLFTPDGKRLLSASSDATVKVWDLELGLEVMTLRQSNEPLVSLAISKDGSVLAAGGNLPYQGPSQGNEQRICLWSARPAQPAPQGRRYPFLEAATGFNMVLPSPVKAYLPKPSSRPVNLWEMLPALDTRMNELKVTKGLDNVETLQSMNVLAAAYWQADQLDKSVPLFEEAYKRRLTLSGRAHINTLLLMANLGVNYKDAGRYAEALPLLEESYQASTKEAQMKWVGIPLLDCYLLAGKHEQATALRDKLLDEARSTLPKDSSLLAAQLSRLASASLKAGDAQKAEQLLREILALREKLEPDLWSTFYSKALLGAALIHLKQYKLAEPLLLTGYEGMKQREQSVSPRNRSVQKDALDQLIRLYQETKQPAEEKRWQAEREKVNIPQK